MVEELLCPYCGRYYDNIENIYDPELGKYKCKCGYRREAE